MIPVWLSIVIAFAAFAAGVGTVCILAVLSEVIASEPSPVRTDGPPLNRH